MISFCFSLHYGWLQRAHYRDNYPDPQLSAAVPRPGEHVIFWTIHDCSIAGGSATKHQRWRERSQIYKDVSSQLSASAHLFWILKSYQQLLFLQIKSHAQSLHQGKSGPSSLGFQSSPLKRAPQLLFMPASQTHHSVGPPRLSRPSHFPHNFDKHEQLIVLFPVTFPHFLQLLLIKFQFTKVSVFFPPFF